MWSRLGILLALVPATVGVSPAAAAEDPKPVGWTSAFCTGEIRETADPGFWLIMPGEITISGVGTLRCVGEVGGKRLTGQPGRLVYQGSYDGRMAGLEAPLVGDTCLSGSGSGTWEATLPTEEGSALTYSGPWDFEYIFIFSTLHGALGPFDLAMEWVYYPDPETWSPDEDCVRKPFREAVGRGAGALR